MNNNLLDTIEELKSENSLTPIGLSFKAFSHKSNNILQAQKNTIIKLLLKLYDKLDDLDTKIKRLENNNKIIVERLEISSKAINIKDILGPKVILKK